MPTTLFGVAFYVFALFPGVAFTFARDGHHPAGKRSVVRETASVVFISTLCDAVVALIAAAVIASWPDARTTVSHILESNLAWPRQHLLVTVAIIVVAIIASTLLGLLLGTEWAHDHGLQKLWDSGIGRDTTAWSELLHPKDAVKVVVGITLKSGTWISGGVYAYDANPDPEPTRTITLSGDLTIRAAGADESTTMDTTDWLVIQASDIELLQVSYLANDAQTDDAQS